MLDHALILGRQVGGSEPPSVEAWREQRGRGGAGGTRPGAYYHNVETFQAMWDAFGKRTKTKWKVIGDLMKQNQDQDDVPKMILRFAVKSMS